MNPEIDAGATKYRSHIFRSRLAAQWAVFFDAIGIDWEQVDEGFDLDYGDYYHPDFWLPTFSGGMYADAQPLGGDFSLAHDFCYLMGKSVWLCEGPPDYRACEVVRCLDQHYNHETHLWESLPSGEYTYLRQIGIPLNDQAADENRMFWEPGYENADLTVDEMYLDDWFRDAVTEARTVAFEGEVLYGYFYPESGKPVPKSELYTVKEDAIDHFAVTHPQWRQVRPAYEKDLAVFINNVNGIIVVVRQVPTKE